MTDTATKCDPDNFIALWHCSTAKLPVDQQYTADVATAANMVATGFWNPAARFLNNGALIRATAYLTDSTTEQVLLEVKSSVSDGTPVVVVGRVTVS